MPYFEYKVVPAPDKTPRVRGLKGADRFAYTLEAILGDMGAEGWEYVRADRFEDTERRGLGLTAKSTVTRCVLIFRREVFYEDEASDPPAQEAPADVPEPDTEVVTEPSPSRRLVADPADRAAE
ncbi:hypothetical protein roselon_03332 [Roseibacterium elongatum DSM 19469]|uniref:DUF4177 domain-containing protein n=1 Tax=Roseicyclus elongatus DSM 19469 TaxID=1294273 RepID=W8SST5_9RHOB|nr:hypothetical protein [Roseibacterium elongatum]AHM05590.1 hypothetical protein roselon_03332 [Roseibacterium elongatum DSM 19469]